ncbi:hypothetical protein BT96DRAFT_835809 [Gymnopus androsaceus JB14]|uniref:Uncharacterized protein n=1 Tax=Gymnopus androsaceus JB14 TaxID=1447944 RepID=A0A6A4GUI6_9AGAR|nr:hypothetical protein BT96DRAFT_835809 [Gymnopus androsaceus JB14]
MEQINGLDQYVRGYPNAVFKAFNNIEQARLHYKEAKCTGVIQLLKQDPQPDDIYIVVQGVRPGVYLHCTLMAAGLAWHGSVAMVTTGMASQGQAILTQWTNEGKFRHLPMNWQFV